jgi:hypothetical protein
MHKYTGVDIISLDDQQIKSQKGTTNILLIKKDDEQKKYSLIVQEGEIVCFFHWKVKDHRIYFRNINYTHNYFR